jgi:hypothetical protein
MELMDLLPSDAARILGWLRQRAAAGPRVLHRGRREVASTCLAGDVEAFAAERKRAGRRAVRHALGRRLISCQPLEDRPNSVATPLERGSAPGKGVGGLSDPSRRWKRTALCSARCRGEHGMLSTRVRRWRRRTIRLEVQMSEQPAPRRKSSLVAEGVELFHTPVGDSTRVSRSKNTKRYGRSLAGFRRWLRYLLQAVRQTSKCGCGSSCARCARRPSAV